MTIRKPRLGHIALILATIPLCAVQDCTAEEECLVTCQIDCDYSGEVDDCVDVCSTEEVLDICFIEQEWPCWWGSYFCEG